MTSQLIKHDLYYENQLEPQTFFFLPRDATNTKKQRDADESNELIDSRLTTFFIQLYEPLIELALPA